MNKPHICVIGSGIAGICATYWLVQSGFQVTVVDKNRYPAQATSRANGSQLSACNAQVWSTWPQIRKAMGWIMDPQAPLRVSVKWDWVKYKWLWQFMRSAMRSDHVTRTQQTVQWAMHSAQALQDIVGMEQIEFDHVKQGILHVYDKESDWQSAQALQSCFEQVSCAWDSLTSAACVDLEPSLHTYPGLVGGIYTHHDSSGDMHKFCVHMVNRLQRVWGVKFLWETPVRLIAPDSDGVWVDDARYDGIVVANGVWAPDLLKQIGDPVSIYPVKGYSVTIQLDETSQQAAPWVSMLDEATKIVCSRLGADRLRVAGTAELCGHNWDITAHRVQPLLNWVHSRFPGVDTSQYTPWAGLRPMTPDQMPVVRESKHDDRVWLAVGMGHLGWTLSPGMMRTLVNQMASRWDLK